jgi:integrase
MAGDRRDFVLRASRVGQPHRRHPGADLSRATVVDTDLTGKVSKKRGGRPVRCALSKLTAKALEKWIAASGKKANDYLFPGRGTKRRRPMSPRHLNRLVKTVGHRSGT